MQKIASRFVMLLYPFRKLNFTKAEAKTTVAPALTQKSNDWITLN